MPTQKGMNFFTVWKPKEGDNMGGKKDPGRFTIGFNTADPTHQAVIELLNRQGRRKAQFIVNAVQHYICCSETPVILQSIPLDSQKIREIVQEVLSRENSTGYAGLSEARRQEYEAVAEKGRDVLGKEAMNGMSDLIGAEAMSTIADTLAAFRQQ